MNAILAQFQHESAWKNSLSSSLQSPSPIISASSLSLAIVSWLSPHVSWYAVCRAWGRRIQDYYQSILNREQYLESLDNTKRIGFFFNSLPPGSKLSGRGRVPSMCWNNRSDQMYINGHDDRLSSLIIIDCRWLSLIIINYHHCIDWLIEWQLRIKRC